MMIASVEGGALVVVVNIEVVVRLGLACHQRKNSRMQIEIVDDQQGIERGDAAHAIRVQWIGQVVPGIAGELESKIQIVGIGAARQDVDGPCAASRAETGV